jgi:hypothetical protein
MAQVSDPLNLSVTGIYSLSAKPIIQGKSNQQKLTGLKWFKIWEDGYDATTKTWGVDRLIAAKGLVNLLVTPHYLILLGTYYISCSNIPSCIPAGYYLLRVEIIGKLRYR